MSDDNVTPFTSVNGGKQEEPSVPAPSLYTIEYMTVGDNTTGVEVEGYAGIGSDTLTIYDQEYRPLFIVPTVRLISLVGEPLDGEETMADAD